MNNWKIWTAFLSVFAAGIIVGVVGFGFALKHQFGQRPDPERFQAMMRERMLNDIREEVRPSAAVMPEIEAAISEVLKELNAVRKETRPRIAAVFKKGAQRIEAQLTPEQAERFKELREKRQRGDLGLFRLPPPPPPMY